MPSAISFKTNKEIDKLIVYLFDKLGVKGKNKSLRWRNFIELTHKYVVNTELEKENLQPPVKVDTKGIYRPDCYYLTITSDGTYYCDGKKLPKEVCWNREKRYKYRKLRCIPKGWKKTRTRATAQKQTRTEVTPTHVQCSHSKRAMKTKYCLEVCQYGEAHMKVCEDYPRPKPPETPHATDDFRMMSQREAEKALANENLKEILIKRRNTKRAELARKQNKGEDEK